MATIQVRVDDELKASADALFQFLGLDTSTAIRIFLNKAIACDGIPFPVRRETDPEALAMLEEVRQMELHPERYKGYTDVDEMFRELNAEIEAEEAEERAARGESA